MCGVVLSPRLVSGAGVSAVRQERERRLEPTGPRCPVQGSLPVLRRRGAPEKAHERRRGFLEIHQGRRQFSRV